MNALEKLINAAKVKRRCFPKQEYFYHKVPTDSEHSIIAGRNGYFDITALSVEEWQMGSVMVVELRGHGKRGLTIKGGMRVTAECFEQMCRDYLLRGLL